MTPHPPLQTGSETSQMKEVRPMASGQPYLEGQVQREVSDGGQ